MIRHLLAPVLFTGLVACTDTPSGGSGASVTRLDPNSTTAMLDTYYFCIAGKQSAGLDAAIAACRGEGMRYATKVARDNGVAARFARENAETFILPTVEAEMRKAFS